MNGQSFKASSMTYATFTIGSHNYALDVLAVKSIVNHQDIAIHSIQSPDFIQGICYWRDKMVPIINFAKLLNEKEDNKSTIFTIIFITVENNEIGLFINDLPNLIKISLENISSDKPKSLSKFISAIAQENNKTFYILDMNSLVLTQDISTDPTSNVNQEINANDT